MIAFYPLLVALASTLAVDAIRAGGARGVSEPDPELEKVLDKSDEVGDLGHNRTMAKGEATSKGASAAESEADVEKYEAKKLIAEAEGNEAAAKSHENSVKAAEGKAEAKQEEADSAAEEHKDFKEEHREAKKDLEAAEETYEEMQARRRREYEATLTTSQAPSEEKEKGYTKDKL